MSEERSAEAIEAATRWAMHDPDPVTRGALDRLIDAEDPSLIERFEGRVAFGTAGLRATVGPGPNAMNALVVRQTTVGVVRWLRGESRQDLDPAIHVSQMRVMRVEPGQQAMQRWLAEASHMLDAPGAHDAERQRQDSGRHDGPMQDWFDGFLSAWLAG